MDVLGTGPFSTLSMTVIHAGQHRLDARFVYLLPDALAARHGRHTVVVPAGFITDLDSVPRLPLVYWLGKGRAVLSAVIHDWLYHSHQLTPDAGAPSITRAQADALFRAAMSDEGVPLLYRTAIYAAVRMFGGPAWRSAGDVHTSARGSA